MQVLFIDSEFNANECNLSATDISYIDERPVIMTMKTFQSLLNDKQGDTDATTI